jgi:Tfp pilus assembly protein PilO
MKALLPILFVVIAGGIFFGFINPTYTSVKVLKAEEATYDGALTKSRELQSVRDQLLARYNTFSQDDLARLAKLIPDNIDNIRLIIDLDGIASNHGMHVRDVALNTGASQADRLKSGEIGAGDQRYDYVTLSFTVSGNYDTFRAFLDDLQSSLRLVDVDSVSFTSTATGIYDYGIGIKTYWLKSS